MKARLQKWGNSLALRIPKNFVDELGLAENSLVELQLLDEQILISPSFQYRLDDLLAQITDENKHDEIDSGASQGNEAW